MIDRDEIEAVFIAFQWVVDFLINNGVFSVDEYFSRMPEKLRREYGIETAEDVPNYIVALLGGEYFADVEIQDIKKVWGL